MRGLILAFALGVWLLQQQATLPGAGWFAALLLLPLLWLLRRYAALFRISTLLFSVLAGFLWAAGYAQVRLADELPSAWEGRDIRVVGVVADLPQLQERGERFLFNVEQVETEGASVPSRISLTDYEFNMASKQQPGRVFHPGERWRLTVRLKQPHGAWNPHGFDFEAWALERNIRATGYIREDAANTRLAPQVWRPAYLVERVREAVRDRFRTVLGDAPYAGILQALVIGDESAIPNRDWELFRKTGVVHLVSISGLHITMIAGLIFALVQALWRRSEILTLRMPARKAATVAGLIAAFAYALLAGFSVPTQRTVFMLAALAAALWSGRAGSMSLALCWAVFVVILLDPWAVTAPGFWLSFGAVALLVYVGSCRLEQRMHWFREALRSQWVIALGLTPLLIALFQQVSIISPLANAIAIPLVSLVVTPLALLGAVIPVDAILHLSHGVMDACMRFLQFCADLPLAVWQQHAPPSWAIIAAVAGAIWLLLPRGFPLRWLGLAALMPMFLLAPPPPVPGAMQVTVLDVGQGTAAVIRTAHHALLYDTGPKYSSEADSGNRIIVPFLRGEGIARLDGMMISHDNMDHSGGAASIFSAMPVGWLASSLPPESDLHALARRDMRCFAGQNWTWDGVHFEVLHPAPESYDLVKLKDNDRSCVLKVSSAYGSVLLTGDIEQRTENELIARDGGALKSDVLLAPHHGSKTSSTAAFVENTHPSATVFTVGYRNRFRHPRPEVEERYSRAGSLLYRSDRDGAVIFGFHDAQAVEVTRWRWIERYYWQKNPAGVDENGPAG
ncbi:MAG: DNA internalization-related competence protein ComEC/Rec2 [Methylobacillus sp.]|jgi:competence protein ComEC|nr:DNA internalization-related competence protein ComEC/Rec2 [Methylobacillus sp.]